MEKTETIMKGYYPIVAETEFLSAAPDVRKVLEEIGSTPVNAYFTAEMKRMTWDMILCV